MSKLFCLEARSDNTFKYLHKEALRRGLDSRYMNYEDLIGDYHELFNLGIDQDTILCMALPFTANNIEQNYQAVVEILLEQYTPQKIINKDMLSSSFLKLEDKLYQTHFFKLRGIPHSPLVDIARDAKHSFPLIVRKRISSRSKNNFIVYTEEELEGFLANNDRAAYVFQQYFPLAKDIRVYILGDQMISAVERTVSIKKGNRVSVRCSHEVELDQAIIDDALRITKEVGATFLGLDVGIKKTGEYFFIEYNGRAQIKSVRENLGIDLSPLLLDYFLEM